MKAPVSSHHSPRSLVHENDKKDLRLKKLCFFFSVIPNVRAIDTAILGSHWFICRPGLHLHKVTAVVPALLTPLLSLLSVFPRLFAAHHVVDFFHLRILVERVFRRHVLNIAALSTHKLITTLAFFKAKQRRADRTEIYHKS